MAIAGTSAQIYFLAVNVAKAHGYFKEEGLDIETVDFAGGAKALEAVIGGSADIDAGSFEHTLQMQAKGQGVQCVVLFGRSVGTVLAIVEGESRQFQVDPRFEGDAGRSFLAGIFRHQYLSQSYPRPRTA